MHDSNPLTGGGERRDQMPEVCPICGGDVQPLDARAWRCMEDSSHYYQWRGERNGGAIRKFLTQSHPAKQGAFYRLSAEERKAFLIQATQRLHVGSYTPHSA